MKIDGRMVRNAALTAGGATVVAGAAAALGTGLACALLWRRFRSVGFSGVTRALLHGRDGRRERHENESAPTGAPLSKQRREAAVKHRDAA